MDATELTLRYGCNPHQAPARAFVTEGKLPFRVLNGAPGYINLLDAINSWRLVRDLKQATGLPAAASFKHVSPAGAALGVPIEPDSDLAKALFLPSGLELTPLAAAYARARGADRISSYGDWVGLSDVVDPATAQRIKVEVSDGVIAPGFEPEALEMLMAKKGGKYPIIEIDPTYEPPEVEQRDVFGISMSQPINSWVPDDDFPGEVVSTRTHMPKAARLDMILAALTVKYVQSNSIVAARDGQVIGAGAGQQSRIHCTRLACDKADFWWLRQHPRVLALPFKDGMKRPERDNAIDQFLLERQPDAMEKVLHGSFTGTPRRLKPDEKREWLEKQDDVALASDAYFPFRDSIDRAAESGVHFVVHPGGSVRDPEVTSAANEHGMLLAHSGTRLFHH
jgi:phosphoribosylaminoimidazolecarboxamide formyltransferase / IMP cyclohydrolase